MQIILFLKLGLKLNLNQEVESLMQLVKMKCYAIYLFFCHIIKTIIGAETLYTIKSATKHRLPLGETNKYFLRQHCIYITLISL